jgi:hypothetical protein
MALRGLAVFLAVFLLCCEFTAVAVVAALSSSWLVCDVLAALAHISLMHV